MKTNLTKKQFLSIAAIIVIGALLGVLILTKGSAPVAKGKEQGHSEKQGQTEKQANAGHKEANLSR